MITSDAFPNCISYGEMHSRLLAESPNTERLTCVKSCFSTNALVGWDFYAIEELRFRDERWKGDMVGSEPVRSATPLTCGKSAVVSSWLS